MANKVFVIEARLSSEQRSRLLTAIPPRFINVWCRHLIWAYRIPDDFAYPDEPIVLTLTGHHVGAGHEALVGTVEVDGQTVSYQACSPARPLHITLSSDDGVPPGAAGDIDPSDITPIDPISLSLSLVRAHAKKLVAERR